jgi:hypothetical protein
MEPMWLAVSYLLGQARRRARAALDGHPESGALTLEWLVIAGLLVAAAVAAGFFLKTKITQWESKVP